MKPESFERQSGECYLRPLWDITSFALAIQFVLTVFYLTSSASTLYRIPDAVLLVQLSIGLLILLVPDLLVYRSTQKKRSGDPPSVAIWTATVAAALVALGFLFPRLELTGLAARLPAVILALLGLPAALFHFSIYLRQPDRWRSFIVVLLGLGFGTYLGFLVWGTGYHSPFFSERILSGVAHIDTMFHSAVANLFQTYRFPTIGLDGAIPLRYHFGSHVVIGSLAGLDRISVLDFYNVSYPIIFVPVFFKALLLAGLDLSRAGLGSWSSRWSIATLIVVLTSLPQPWFAHPFISESNTLGLTAGFLLVSTGARHARAPWFYLAAFCFALLSVFLKISVGVPIFLCLAYVFVRRGEYRSPRKLAQAVGYGALALSSTWLLVLPIRPLTGEEFGGTVFKVVANVFEYAPPVPILYLSWLLAGVLLLTRRGRDEPTRASASRHAALRLWWETLSVLALSTLALATLVWLSRSDATYFLLAYFFLSIPLLLVLAQWILEQAGLRHLWVPFVLLTVLCLLSRVDVITTYRKTNDFRAAAAEENRSEEYQRTLRRRAEFLETLAVLDRLPRVEKRTAAVFVPRTNGSYWELRTLSPAAHFLVQSLTGIALIGGQDKGVLEAETYPYPAYGLRPYRSKTYLETVEDAAAAAARAGYESLFIIDYRKDHFTVERLSLEEPKETTTAP